jgi:sulfate transport system permease protein
MKILLRIFTIVWLVVLLLAPVATIFAHAFDSGIDGFWNALTDPLAVHALGLTVEAAAIAVLINTGFGILIAMVLVRSNFPGKWVMSLLVDLPFAISPIVAGLALMLVWGDNGWFGTWMDAHGVKVIFSPVGIILATVVVTLPFMVREVVPVLQEVGIEQEQAAATLGAGAWSTFWRVTLPSVRWGVTYGVVLTTARALGEFGAVQVVSGNIEGQTETLTTRINSAYQSYDLVAVYSLSVVLAVLALATLGVLTAVAAHRGDNRGD